MGLQPVDYEMLQSYLYPDLNIKLFSGQFNIKNLQQMKSKIIFIKCSVWIKRLRGIRTVQSFSSEDFTLKLFQFSRFIRRCYRCSGLSNVVGLRGLYEEKWRADCYNCQARELKHKRGLFLSLNLYLQASHVLPCLLHSLQCRKKVKLFMSILTLRAQIALSQLLLYLTCFCLFQFPLCGSIEGKRKGFLRTPLIGVVKILVF